MATIIVQETDEAVLEVITLALKEEGHKVIGFLSQCPVALLQKLKQYLPDIVFVDYWGVRETGKTLLSTIKSFSPKIPVIALSCDINIPHIAEETGFNSFITKPFDLEDIYNVLRAFVKG